MSTKLYLYSYVEKLSDVLALTLNGYQQLNDPLFTF